MNGKKAKLLRREAESGTVGKPKVLYNFTLPHRMDIPLLLGYCTRRTYIKLKKEFNQDRR